MKNGSFIFLEYWKKYMSLIIFGIAVLLILLYLIIEWSWFIPAAGNVAILMYHKVTHSENDSLAITTTYLRKQFDYIKRKGYKVVSLSQLMKIEAEEKKLSEKYVVLTFDDGYKNNKELLLPILEEYGFCATISLTVGYIGNENIWDGGGLKLLSYADLKEMSSLQNIEFALHSYKHQSYSDMTIEEIKDDVDECKKQLKINKIPFIAVLAYPYGAYPKKNKEKRERMLDILKDAGIKYALRIGNGMNALPFKKPYEIKRINVRGSDSFSIFKTKLKKGHKKLFE